MSAQSPVVMVIGCSADCAFGQLVRQAALDLAATNRPVTPESLANYLAMPRSIVDRRILFESAPATHRVASESRS